MRKYMLLVFALIIIPSIGWRVWLDCFPELKAIAKCESGLNSSALGDKGKSVGLFQIHLPSHPNISRTDAKDPYFSLAFAIEQYYSDNLDIWTCHRIITKNKGLVLEL